MSVFDPRVMKLARRVRDRIRLAWEESHVSGAPIVESPYAADAGETLWVPARLSTLPARFPATKRYPTIAAVEHRLAASATTIRLVSGAWVPRDAAGVLPLLEHAVGWGRALEPGEHLFCVQPLSNNFVLAADEVEQIVGLAGAVEFVEESETFDGERCLVAGATVRRRACAIALVWTADLVVDSNRLNACLAALARMPDGVRAGAHLIDAPAQPDRAWRSGATRLVTAIAAEPNAVFGVRVGEPPLDPKPVVDVLTEVRGARHRLALQWIERDRDGDLAPAAAPVARGITCDCSLAVSDSASFRPYVTVAPYVPVEFDIRVPSFSDGSTAAIEIPRVDGHDIPARDRRGWRVAVNSPEREAERAFAELLNGPIDAAAASLARVLNLGRRAAYLEALESDRAGVARWHEFHVYNWPAPPRAILRLVAYEASDLARPASSLRALDDLRPGAMMVTGDTLVDWARSIATDAVRSAARVRAQQIAAHGYLASGGRAELTADSEQLIARLPASLGSTLEIGFGYALTARRVGGRATRYVGIDLQTEQARALRDTGGLGVVGDLQALPLAGGSFDTVIADNVLEHASSPLDALRELRRVLRPRGRVYALIPLDASTSAFTIRTHLWKADERSIRRAAELTGFRVVDLDVLEYAALAVYGCFPASCGQTCLAVLEPIAVAERRIAG